MGKEKRKKNTVNRTQCRLFVKTKAFWNLLFLTDRQKNAHTFWKNSKTPSIESVFVNTLNFDIVSRLKLSVF